MTTFEISIERLGSELLEAYARWGLERGAKGPDAINWALDANIPNFAVARTSDRIVGISANIPRKMVLEGKYRLGFQAVDSFVDISMRGNGLFHKMAKAFSENANEPRADLIWGFPNDQAAPAWFGKLGWKRHGQVPFLFKPLRSGFFFRKLRVPLDFPIGITRDQGLKSVSEIGDWGDEIWARYSHHINCATIRDKNFLNWRLFHGPDAKAYRVVADPDPVHGALLATRTAEKHGARIAYIMEAMGGPSLRELLVSELARLRVNGEEVALAWSYPWSPNYRALRDAGFLPLPERLRPINIWFGARSISSAAIVAQTPTNWYLSYLDSDTV